jgi:hypothetical protein
MEAILRSETVHADELVESRLAEAGTTSICEIHLDAKSATRTSESKFPDSPFYGKVNYF